MAKSYKTKAEILPVHDFEKDPVLEGTYEGSREVDTGMEKPSRLHKLATERGSVEFWGCWILDQNLTESEVGRDVRITAQGRVERGEGRQPMKAFKVEIAE